MSNDRSLLSEDHGLPIDGPIEPLKCLFAKSVAKHRDDVALAALHQPADLYSAPSQSSDYLRWTYGTLADQAELLASALAQRGLARGETIVSLANNCAEWAISYWASAILATAHAPVNGRQASKADEIQHILRLADAKVVIARDADMAATLDKSAPEQMKLTKAKIIVGSESDAETKMPGWEYMADVLADAHHAPRLRLTAEQPDRDIAEEQTLVVFTSGTTSLPKGCIHTNRTVSSTIKAQIPYLALTPKSISLDHIPTSHVFGINYSQSFWSAGGRVVYPAEVFSAGAALKAIDAEKPTNFPAVPSMLGPIFDHPDLAKTDTSSLLHAELAGSLIMPEDLDECRNKLGCKTAASTYGMSEGVPTITWSFEQGGPPDSFDGHVSAGRVARGAFLRVCAPDSRKPLPRGEMGELHQGGMQTIRGYIGLDSDSCYEDEHGPWIMTGDQAIMSPNGEVTVLGRYKDLIIRGGENISPAAIEAVLNQTKGIFVSYSLLMMLHIRADCSYKRHKSSALLMSMRARSLWLLSNTCPGQTKCQITSFVT